MSESQLLLSAIATLSGVVLVLWRLNLQKDAEIKALMREMIGLSKDVRQHLRDEHETPSKLARPRG